MTTVRDVQLSDAEVGAAAGDLIYVYYARDLARQKEAPGVHKTGGLMAHISHVSEPHLGDDKAVIRLNIGNADRLGHQHVLSILRFEENIFQQLPAPKPRVHPCGLLPRRKVEEGVDLQDIVICTGSQKKGLLSLQHPTP
ncbi:unnamed protein product [Schistocephalus solidus]|uniref:Uncharacterized protein n=1 Tax=Schistocephalus solidus TaxID=70667 RepID=A0A183SX14_SCHSO|nr:unnamed protein product [Schistocephalus solidus]